MRTVNPEALFDFLDDEGHDPAFREGDTEIAIVCPLCGDEKRRLYVEASSGVWICFRCGEQGSLLDLLIDVCGIEPATAMAQRSKLRRPFVGDIRFPRETKTHSPSAEMSLPAEFVIINKGNLEGNPYLEYLYNRGISLTRAQEFGIGYCPEGYYAGRLIIPVGHEGKLYTFVARSIDPKAEKRVLYPLHSAPSETLFNYDRVSIGKEKAAVLVEGVFDVMRFLPTSGLAVLGSKLSPKQVSLLKKLKRLVVIAFDGDKAGEEGGRDAADRLAAALIPTKLALLPQGEDPASIKEERLRVVLDTAREYQL